tara:strand:+ start:53 stop:364 length:312 start_codon:yes stop_codon:yes gene_type:complete
MKLTKRQLKRIIKEEKAKILQEAQLDIYTESGLKQVCTDSFEHDTLFKVQGVILESYPDCDPGGEADVHVAALSNGLELDFEQLSDLVCEWMVDYARACISRS